MDEYTTFDWELTADEDTNCHEPNEVTRNALLEADRLTNDPHTRYFSNVEEALEELKKD